MPFVNDGDEGVGRDGARQSSAGSDDSSFLGKRIANAMPPIEAFRDATLEKLEQTSVRVAERVVRDTIAPRIELLRADLRQFTRESEDRVAELTQRTTKQLSDAAEHQLALARAHVDGVLSQLDEIVERRIASVERESLHAVEVAVTRVVTSAGKEVESLLDGLYRKLLGVIVPISAVLMASKVSSSLHVDDTPWSAIIASWAAAGAVTGAVGLAHMAQAWLGRNRTTSLSRILGASLLDLLPFLGAAAVLGAIASL